MAPVVALKGADVAAAGTVMDAGTVRVALVFVRVTIAPPAGAAFVKVTVQVVEALGPTLAGLQAREETRTGASRDRLVEVDVPLREAVSVAV